MSVDHTTVPATKPRGRHWSRTIADEQTKKGQRDEIIRQLVAESSTRFARDLIDRGVDRAAVMYGFRDTCAALRDDALAESEPGGNA